MKYCYSIHYSSIRGELYHQTTLDHEITDNDIPDIEYEIELSIGCDNVTVLSYDLVEVKGDK